MTNAQIVEAVIMAAATSAKHAASVYRVTDRTLRIWKQKCLEEELITEDDLHKAKKNGTSVMAQHLNKRFMGDAAPVLAFELTTQENTHVEFLKDSMEARNDLLELMLSRARKCKSLRELTYAFSEVNRSIETFSAAIPLSTMKYQDDMYQAAQKLLEYKKEFQEIKDQYNNENTEDITSEEIDNEES